MNAFKAAVRIKSEESLEGVARRLQEGLLLPPFHFDSDWDPPHAITATNECLGHELWLTQTGSEFELTLESETSGADFLNTTFIDVSAWLAKHIGIVTDLDCEPINSESPK